MRERLYARQIERRVITILDVPCTYWEAVLSLLSESEETRQRRIIEEQGLG